MIYQRMSESRGFYLWLTQVIVLLGLIALFTWISLLPKRPNYTIVNLYVPSLDSRKSPMPSDDTSTNSTIEFVLEISNPNKDSGIYYDDTIVTVYFGDDDVGTMVISSCYQGYGKTARHQMSLYTNRPLSRGPSDGKTDMKLQTATKIRYKTWGVKSKHHGVNMHGNVRIGSDGKIFGKKKKIKLHRTRKKWRLH